MIDPFIIPSQGQLFPGGSVAFVVHLHQEESKGACCTSGAEEAAQYGQGPGSPKCRHVLRVCT